MLTSGYSKYSTAKAFAVNTPRPVANLPRPSRTVVTRRTVAKAGMSVSLGVLLWTAMTRSRKVMHYHTLAGVALLGFTVWHLTLYRARNKTFDE